VTKNTKHQFTLGNPLGEENPANFSIYINRYNEKPSRDSMDLLSNPVTKKKKPENPDAKCKP